MVIFFFKLLIVVDYSNDYLQIAQKPESCKKELYQTGSNALNESRKQPQRFEQ